MVANLNLCSWVLVDLDFARSTRVPSDSVMTIGACSSSDVVLHNSGDADVALQIVTTLCFAFFIEGGSVTSHCGRVQFSCSGRNFLLRHEEFWQVWHEQTLCEADVARAFKNSTFKELLQVLQFEALNDTQANLQMPLGVENESFEHSVIKRACIALDTHFWNQRDPFEKTDVAAFQVLVWALWAQICKLGALTYLLRQEDITEIMVTGLGQVYTERKGHVEPSLFSFDAVQDVWLLAERMVDACGRRLDESHPYCEARLADGSRAHIIIPPLSLDGPAITIRKFSARPMDAEALENQGMMTAEVSALLKNLVEQKRNILISGGTGTGKTTLLGVLGSFIHATERIVTIEDSAELRLQKPHVVRLEARLANSEGRGAVSVRDLVKNALRMRPDRIIIGECRGGEALDMLQAMNTGHAGSMSTLHANSPRDALRRLETLVLFAGFDFPLRAVREHIHSAIDVIIQLKRDQQGVRRIWSVHSLANEELGTHEWPDSASGTQEIVFFEEHRKEWKWNLVSASM